jgi:hypothetical protein
VCLVGEPRERSGADSLSRLFGWGAAGAEPLPREYTLEKRVGSVPRNSADGAAPLLFASSVSIPFASRLSPGAADKCVEAMVALFLRNQVEKYLGPCVMSD